MTRKARAVRALAQGALCLALVALLWRSAGRPSAGPVARRLASAAAPKASDGSPPTDIIQDVHHAAHSLTFNVSVPTPNCSAPLCGGVTWLRVTPDHILPEASELAREKLGSESRFWVFGYTFTAVGAANCACMELVNRLYELGSTHSPLPSDDLGDAEPLLVCGLTAYHAACWALAVFAFLFGYINSKFGVDFEFFIAWEGLVLALHWVCLIGRFRSGRPALGAFEATAAVAVSLTPVLSEPLDAFRDPTLVMVYLSQFGKGWLPALLSTCGVAAALLAVVRDNDARAEQFNVSWKLYVLPGKLAAPEEDPEEHLDDGADRHDRTSCFETFQRSIEMHRAKLKESIRQLPSMVLSQMVEKTSPLHQALVAYEEVPQTIAAFVFLWLGGDSDASVVVGAIAFIKVVLTTVLRPYLLAWHAARGGAWTRVSPRDIRRARRAVEPDVFGIPVPSCVRRRPIIQACCDVASCTSEGPQVRKAALDGLTVLLGKSALPEAEEMLAKCGLIAPEVLAEPGLLDVESQAIVAMGLQGPAKLAKQLRRDHEAKDAGRIVRTLQDMNQFVEEAATSARGVATIAGLLGPHLQLFLNHGDRHVRESAVTVAGKMRLSQEITASARDGAPEVRRAAAEALRTCPAKEALPVLLELSAEGERELVRSAALEALGAHIKARGVEDMREVLLVLLKASRDANGEVRCSAARALGPCTRAGDAKEDNAGLALARLRELSKEDKNRKVSETASEVLGFGLFALQEHGKVRDFFQKGSFHELQEKLLEADEVPGTVVADLHQKCQELAKLYEKAIKESLQGAGAGHSLLDSAWRIINAAREPTIELYRDLWSSICDTEMSGCAAFSEELGLLRQHVPPNATLNQSASDPVKLLLQAKSAKKVLQDTVVPCFVDTAISVELAPLEDIIEAAALQPTEPSDKSGMRSALTVTATAPSMWALSRVLRTLRDHVARGDLAVCSIAEGFCGQRELKNGWHCAVHFHSEQDPEKHIVQLELHHDRIHADEQRKVADAKAKPLKAAAACAAELLARRMGRECAAEALGLAQFYAAAGTKAIVRYEGAQASDDRHYHVSDHSVHLKDCSWLSDAPLANWEGVEVDEDGRVVGVSLRGKGMKGTGAWAAGLLALDRLATLDLRDNDGLQLPQGAPTSMVGELLYTTREKVLAVLEHLVPRPEPRFKKLLREYGPHGPCLYDIYQDPAGPCKDMTRGLWFQEGRELRQFHGVTASSEGFVERLDFKDLSSFSSLPRDSLPCIRTLKMLGLERTRGLRTLPESLVRCEALEEIVLSFSGIEALPEGLGASRSLKKLDLYDTKALRTLPESLVRCEALEYISLSYSGIEALPEGLGASRSLKKLVLFSTKALRTLPESLGRCEALEEIDLQHSGIETLPESLGALRSLKKLDLSYTKALRTLPEGLVRCEALEYIDLQLSGIEALPESLVAFLRSRKYFRGDRF